MNNTFSLRRTLLYARKHYVENARSYLYAIATALLLLTGIFLFSFVRSQQTCSVLSVLLSAAFIYFVTLMSCRCTPMTLSCTLPVSPLEKYLFTWFNAAVVSLLLCLLFRWPFSAAFGMFDLPSWLLILTVQAAMLLAGCWVRTNPLKVLIPLVCAFILFYVLYFTVLKTAAGLFVRIPFADVNAYLRSDTAVIWFQLPRQLSEHVAYTVIFGFWIPVCWLAGYFKFRERTLK